MANEDLEGKGLTEDQTKGEMVQLDPETYQALLNRVQELEGLVEGKVREGAGPVGKKTYSLDELAEEGRRTTGLPRRELTPEDFQDPQKLAGIIYEAIVQQVISPLEAKVETLRATLEIDMAARMHPDFWEYGDDIRQMAISKPQLSIEECYQLCKAKDPERGKRKDEAKDVGLKKDGKLFHLPKVPTSGEKPTGHASLTSVKAPTSRREAAELAWANAEKSMNKEEK